MFRDLVITISGPRGSGKSFLAALLIRYLRKLGGTVEWKEMFNGRELPGRDRQERVLSEVSEDKVQPFGASIIIQN
jgi:pantothenate kinase-related protein Tda10